MPTEAKSHLRLEIAHVLFIDIVGYSKLLIDEQKELLQELNEIVRKTDQVRAAEAEGKLVRLPTGDGMALVFSNNPEAPVECALEISKALQNHPEIKLRMGIHSGAVNQIADVNDRSNVAGAGINIAQRVMDCGDGDTFFSPNTSRKTSRNIGAGNRICTIWANAKSNTASASLSSISTPKSWEIRQYRKSSRAFLL